MFATFDLCDLVYFDGTVDRSEGSERIVQMIADAAGPAGVRAEHIPLRADCAARIVALAKPGDCIVIMGARDDSLSAYASDILKALS